MIRILSTILVGLVLSGCAYQRTQKAIERNDQTDSMITERIQAAKADRNPVVKVDARPWVSLQPLAPKITDYRLPDSAKCNLTFAPVQPVTLGEFSQVVTQLCGIPVRVTSDAMAFVSGTGAVSAGGLPPVPPLPTGNGATAALMPRPGPTPIVPQLVPSAGGYGAGAGLIRGIKWSGKPLSGLLDVVTARLGLSWRYSGGAVSIFHLDTRTFRLMAMPSTAAMRSTVTAGSELSKTSGGGSTGIGGTSAASELTGGSNQSTEITIDSNIAKDVETLLKSMLTAQGRLQMSRSTGTIAVTDTPEVLSRIESYLQAENRNLRRMVRLNIDLLVVSRDDNDRFGFNLDAVYRQVAGKYGAGLLSNVTPGEGAVVASFGILDTAGSEWSGSEIMFDALSTLGSVSVLTTPTINTLNLQPAPLQIAEQQYFLAEADSTPVPNVGVTGSERLGVVTTGFNVNVLPYVLDSDHLQLQISGSLSPRATIRQVKGSRVEAPNTTSRTFSQQVELRSGQTVVLSGYEQLSDQGDKSGVGDPGFIALGGSFARRSTREVLVILITPVIFEPEPLKPEAWVSTHT